MKNSILKIKSKNSSKNLLTCCLSPEIEMAINQDLTKRQEILVSDSRLEDDVVFYFETLDEKSFETVDNLLKSGYNVYVRNSKGFEFNLKNFRYDNYISFEMGLWLEFVDRKF